VLHIVPQIRYLEFSHLKEEGSIDYDRGFVRLQIHVNFDMIIYLQHPIPLKFMQIPPVNGDNGILGEMLSGKTRGASWVGEGGERHHGGDDVGGDFPPLSQRWGDQSAPFPTRQ
jgi:hypothetical protein